MPDVFAGRIAFALTAALLAGLSACGPGFVDSGDVNAPGAQSASTSTTTGGSDGSVPTTCGVDAYTNYGQQFFTTNCGPSCHGEKQTYSGISSDLSAITSQIQTNLMPQGATLTPTAKARVLAWLACGAPENPTTTGSTSATAGGSSTTTTTGGSSTTTTGGSTTTTTTGGTGSNCTNDTYSNYAQNFFSNNCTSCHTAGGTSPSLTSYASVKSNSAKVNTQVSQGLMPPSPSSISASDKQRIETWISCGLPQ